MELALEAIGLTKEELRDRVVDGLVAKLSVEEGHVDDDGDEYTTRGILSRISDRIGRDHESRIKAAVVELSETYVDPVFKEAVRDVTMQQTDMWGQKTGKAVSFHEFIAKEAKAYLNEQVDADGKTRAQVNSYSFRENSSRLVYLISAELRKLVHSAMDEVVKQMGMEMGDAVSAEIKRVASEYFKTKDGK